MAQVSDRILAKIQRNCDSNESTLYPSDPKGNFMQFDMEDEANGFPCVHLTESGCDIHETKPPSCTVYPSKESSIEYCVGCSYTFDENGNRSGTCNGCNVE